MHTLEKSPLTELKPAHRNFSSRYLQTSSTTKYPAAAPAINESNSSSSPNSSTGPSFSNSDNDESLNFTNATIQRLLQEELSAIESSFSINTIQNSSVSPFGNDIQNEIKIDIKQALKQKQQELQQSPSPTNTITNKSITINTKPTMAQLLEKFDPQSPPPNDASPYEIQQWLECSAQQESVQKYESLLQSARDREDYTSLSLVQKHLLEWYNPLRQRIIQEQESYFSTEKRKTSANKYGPYLCTLQPEKLALLTCHEATMFALKKGGDSATLVTMALKISDAIEAEVNVQRLLKKRMDEQRGAVKEQKGNDSISDDGSAGEDVAAASAMQNSSTANSNSSDESTEKEMKEIKSKWMYGPSHLQRFADELNRSDPSRKGKIRIQRANRRAMQLLESAEPWPTSEKVMLGVVLIHMLVDTAKINFRGSDYNGGAGVPAFVYEKRWLSDQQTVGFVAMNEDFYKMVVEDKFTSLDAYTSRHKPMVIPPNDWVSWDEGGYSVLNTSFMRTKGCQIQKVRS